jgi:hypothetical protein
MLVRVLPNPSLKLIANDLFMQTTILVIDVQQGLFEGHRAR